MQEPVRYLDIPLRPLQQWNSVEKALVCHLHVLLQSLLLARGQIPQIWSVRLGVALHGCVDSVVLFFLGGPG